LTEEVLGTDEVLAAWFVLVFVIKILGWSKKKMLHVYRGIKAERQIFFFARVRRAHKNKGEGLKKNNPSGVVFSPISTKCDCGFALKLPRAESVEA